MAEEGADSELKAPPLILSRNLSIPVNVYVQSTILAVFS